MADSKDVGLYQKYDVRRMDGKPLGLCFVFELSDPRTWDALEAWAFTLRGDGYLALARDVEAAVDRARNSGA